MLNKVLDKFEEIFISIALLLITAILFINVVTRYGFGFSLKWAEELTRYVLVWITFIGGSYCIREHAHVGIDAFVMKLPLKARWVVRFVVFLICIVFSLALMVIGWQLVGSVVQSRQLSPTMMVPMYYAYAAIPVGGLLMIYRYFQVAIEALRKREQFYQKDGGESGIW